MFTSSGVGDRYLRSGSPRTAIILESSMQNSVLPLDASTVAQIEMRARAMRAEWVRDFFARLMQRVRGAGASAGELPHAA